MNDPPVLGAQAANSTATTIAAVVRFSILALPPSNLYPDNPSPSGRRAS